MRVKFNSLSGPGYYYLRSDHEYDESDLDTYKISKEYFDVIDKLGLRSKVDEVFSKIDSAKFVLQPTKSSREEYELETPYGSGYTYWKSPENDYYEFNFKGDFDHSVYNHHFTKDQNVVETLLKDKLKLDLVNTAIRKLVYTGTHYGFGNREYTELGYRYRDILKRAGFDGV